MTDDRERDRDPEEPRIRITDRRRFATLGQEGGAPAETSDGASSPDEPGEPDAELGAMPVARRMLEVLDDFELALMSADETSDFQRFLKGVELVYAKLVDALKAEGLERIEAEGKPFDPELHEALMQTGEGEGEPYVVDVLRPGYTLKGRVIRPAGVRVERR